MSHIDDRNGEFTWLDTRYRALLGTADTGGAISVVDSVSPVGSGPPRHIHRDADETFVILSGECLFWIDGKTTTRGPGESVFVPRGTEHTFLIVGDRPCRHLVILTPGGFEGFFAEMAERQLRVPQDMEAIVEAGARFQLEFTGPPITPEEVTQ